MVCILSPPTAIERLANMLCHADDILADIVGDSDDTLGLDHANKNRGFWNGGGSFFIR